jgi:dynamin-binding protein
MESFPSPHTHDNSLHNSFVQPISSNNTTNQSDGLGLTLNSQSPEMSTSPARRVNSMVDSARTASLHSKPEQPQIDTKTSIRQGSWGLPSSPAPKNRPRRDTEENEGSNRDSRRSKRSMINLSPAYTPSTDPTTDRSSAGNFREEKDEGLSQSEKHLAQRWNFLKELIDTEHTYYHDMTIGVDIFLATAPAVTSLTYEDRRLIFGNIEKIRDLAFKVLEALKKSVHTVYRVPPENRFQFKRGSAETQRDSSATPSMGYKPEPEVHAMMDRETGVGAAFCQLAPEMDRLFKNWMIHSEKSNRRIQQVKKDPQVKMWLEECYENAKDITNAWDLDSLLVKPTQRYMKYPLLLTGILSCTPTEHPDYDNIVRALQLIENSVAGINEEKRRREVATELLAQKSKKEINSRINLKNFAMFGRQKGQKPRAGSRDVSLPSLGSPPPNQASSDNDNYEIVRQKFGGHFFQLQIVMRDFEKYLEDTRFSLAKLTAYAHALESSYRFDIQSRFPEQESRVHRYLEAVSSIQKHMLPEHIKTVEKFVIVPVRKLWTLHEKPQVLMGKHRKLKPSYQKYSKEKDKDKTNEKIKTEAEQWIALNQLLQDELPQLYRLTGEIVQACLMNFLEIQCRWESMWMAKLKPFIDDRDIDQFFECDFGEFLMLIQDEFFNDFDNIELEVGAMATTSGNLAAFIAVAEKGKDVKWIRSAEELDENESIDRPSTGKNSSLAPGTHSTRVSIEHANRSTPNLNMTITSPNGFDSGPHRRSYNNALSPAPNSNAFAMHEGGASGYFQGLASAPVSGGPGTPTGLPTPGPSSANRQFFESDWVNHQNSQFDSVLPPSAMHSSTEMNRLNRGIDGISSSNNNHGSDRLAQQYPQVSHYDQIMASQTYHSRHHSNPPPPGSSSSSNYHLAPTTPGEFPSSQLPSPRYSGIFHSALPADMADDEAELLPKDTNGEVRVLFVVASLFEFHIDSNRREAGYPYLKYVAGEIFEIVGQRGELWLARNQDDEHGTLGWIWEKHFALLPMEPQ